MAKKGSSKHLKRLAAPAFWSIMKKEYKWIVKPSPGPHALYKCIPLLVLVRDMLRLAENSREAKRIIFDGEVFVDGKIRQDYRFPIGSMDVVMIPKASINIRIVPYAIKYLWYINIPPEETKLKLVRIENKTLIKGDKIQLNLSDGRNIVVSRGESIKYKTLDTLLIEIPSQVIVKHIPLKTNMFAMTIDGRNVGRFGKIVEIIERPGMKRRHSLVVLEDPLGHRFQTILGYIMAVGDNKPIIKLSEGV